MVKKMKHIILANPVSGKKKGKIYALRVKDLLKKNNIDSEIILSEYPKHLTKVAKELSQNDKCRFYSLGGDGTLNEIATGIIGTDSEIVVVPCGTGNDFLRSISKYNSMRKIINASIKKDSTPTDVITFGKDRYCINILNMGFDAMIAKNVDKFRNVPLISGSAKYNLSIMYSMASGKNFKFKISSNGKSMKGRFTLAVVANGCYYGGGIKPCPNADVSDALLDICLINSTETFAKLKLLPRYKKGNHLDLKQVNIFKTKEIKIVSTRKFPISADGEMYYMNRLHIKVLPKALNIVHID